MKFLHYFLLLPVLTSGFISNKIKQAVTPLFSIPIREPNRYNRVNYRKQSREVRLSSLPTHGTHPSPSLSALSSSFLTMLVQKLLLIITYLALLYDRLRHIISCLLLPGMYFSFVRLFHLPLGKARASLWSCTSTDRRHSRSFSVCTRSSARR